jgi:uncharacterized PurR-regulated membrane protein YhhQ (DUF165 family)
MIEYVTEYVTELALLFLVQVGFVVYGTLQSTAVRLRLLMIVNMMLITIFAPLMVTIGGVSVNSTAILYASVMVAQIIILERFGIEEANQTIYHVLYAIVLAIVTIIIVALIPAHTPIWDDTFEFLAKYPQRAVAAVMAFWLAQSIAVAMYQSTCVMLWSVFARMVAVMSVAQVIDSVVFYPTVLLGRVSVERMLEVAVVGFSIKMVIGFVLLSVALPFLSKSPLARGRRIAYGRRRKSGGPREAAIPETV